MKLSAIATAAILAFSSVNAAPAPTTTTTSGPVVNQFNIYKAGSFVNIDNNFIMPLQTKMVVPVSGITLRFVPDNAANVNSVQFYFNGVLSTTDNSSPYFISGEQPGMLLSWTPPPHLDRYNPYIFDVSAKVNYKNSSSLTVTAKLCGGTTISKDGTVRGRCSITNSNAMTVWRPWRW